MVCYGIDPLVSYLDKRLQGICIYSTPTLGPTLPGSPPLAGQREVYRLIAYVDDVKPAITSMNEFLLVDRASLIFELQVVNSTGIQHPGRSSSYHLDGGEVPCSRRTFPYPT